MKNSDNSLLFRQKEICDKYNSPFFSCGKDEISGIALLSLNEVPIYGVRRVRAGGACGWFLWGGDRSDADDFFSPVHLGHLEEIIPLVLPYLGLAPGFKFIIDKNGYEDVWYDPEELDKFQ